MLAAQFIIEVDVESFRYLKSRIPTVLNETYPINQLSTHLEQVYDFTAQFCL